MSNQTKQYDYENNIESGYYDKILKRKKGMQCKWHYLKFIRVISMFGNSTKHLDIGCGPGSFIGMLDNSIESVGVDLAADQIAYAQETYGSDSKKFICLKDGKLPFSDGEFDVITILEVIEHLNEEQTKNVLSEANRCLKSGGKLILTTPNYGSLWPMLEFFVNKLSKLSYEDQHINCYKRKRLALELAQMNFNNIKVKSFQGISFLTAALSWKFASLINCIERKLFLDRLYGFLILVEANK